MSIYPVPKSEEQLLSDLGPYLSGKGTLKFPLNAPIPHDLIRSVTRSLGDQRR